MAYCEKAIEPAMRQQPSRWVPPNHKSPADQIRARPSPSRSTSTATCREPSDQARSPAAGGFRLMSAACSAAGGPTKRSVTCELRLGGPSTTACLRAISVSVSLRSNWLPRGVVAESVRPIPVSLGPRSMRHLQASICHRWGHPVRRWSCQKVPAASIVTLRNRISL